MGSALRSLKDFKTMIPLRIIKQFNSIIVLYPFSNVYWQISRLPVPDYERISIRNTDFFTSLVFDITSVKKFF
jgi:hypothetical protein